MRNDIEEVQRKVKGVLLGLAAGDRIGGPTTMALLVSDSILEKQSLNLRDVGERYLSWWRQGAFDTGPTTAQVLRLVDKGISFQSARESVHLSSKEMTAGCNPVHRSAILAMSVFVKNNDLHDAAISEAQLTHRHPLAGDVAAAVVSLCRFLILGIDWPQAVMRSAEGRLQETQNAMFNSSGSLERTGFAPSALSAAMFFVGSSESFARAISRSIQFAGYDNYCPVLVGSIGGARWGSDEIAIDMLSHHSNRIGKILTNAKTHADQWAHEMDLVKQR